MKITFVLPSVDRSGGVRVTIAMANILIERGYNVRIVYKLSKHTFLYRYKHLLRDFSFHRRGISNFSWLNYFNGEIISYINLNAINFEENEVVVAVGSFTINDVNNISNNKIKRLRYCHGFIDHMPDFMKSVWSIKMDTITVSSVHIPHIENLSGDKVIAIVPNGIDLKEYFVENIKRDGIGTVYSPNPIKSPEDTIEILQQFSKRWPSIPQYVFSVAPRPRGITKESYYRYPSIHKSRELYNRSKAWLVTSKNEGFGLPILEGMACGAVVISTNFKNSYQLIKHNENGFIVPVGDIDAFMHYINLILNNDEERKTIANNALKTVQRYSWNNIVDKFEDAIRKM